MLVNQTGNMTHDFKMCSYEQLTRLHNATLEVLERTGVKVYEEEALKLFADGGAYVDFDNKIVKLPAGMVKTAIDSAPSRIVVANPEGKRSIFLERNNVYYGTGTDLPLHVDPYTNEVRTTNLKDVENVAKVVEKSDNIDFVSNQGLAEEVPQHLHDLITMKAMREYCSKPNMATATDKGNLMALIDMSAEMAGGYEELRRNPTIMLYNEPVSPLMNSEEAIQKLMLCAEYGIPTTYAAGGVSGGTSPVTLSGSIISSNAECLAGLVLHQLVRKGSPFIYGYVFGAMDMMTTMNVYGGPELGMVHTVMADLSKYYDIPMFGTSGCTDALEVDAQAGTEAMYSILCAALSGQNLVHDNGYTGVGAVGNLSMLLLANEQIGFAKRFTEGIKYDEESFAIDLIDKVSHGGEYVSQKHTSKHFREEVFYPKHFNRRQYLAWKTEDGLSLNEKFGNAVKEIIEADTPSLLDDRTKKVFDEIISDRAKQLEIDYK